METLLIIGLIMLLVLLGLLVGVLLMIYKFLRDLRYLANLVHVEADKLALDAAALRARISKKSTWLALILGLVSRRGAIKQVADTFWRK